MSTRHVWLAALLGGLAGCVATVGEDLWDEPAAAASGLARDGVLTVVQVNPYYGGRHDRRAYRRPGFSPKTARPTWETARTFADTIATSYPQATLLGMQEMGVTDGDDAVTSETMRAILAARTGHPWRVRYYHRHSGPSAPPATHQAIFWRSDVLEMLEDYGTKMVDEVHTGSGILHNRFAGALFRVRGTTREVGFFTGKLTWMGQTVSGRSGRPHRITHDDRAYEIEVLHRWMRAKMADRPGAPRVIALDMNDDFGSAAWRELRRHYRDGGSERATWWSPRTGNGHRFDYVFYSPSSAVGSGPRVSPDFGSDHRAVIARVFVPATGRRGSTARAATTSGAAVSDEGATATGGDTGAGDPPPTVEPNLCGVRCCDGTLRRMTTGTAEECRAQYTWCADHDRTLRMRFESGLIYTRESACVDAPPVPASQHNCGVRCCDGSLHTMKVGSTTECRAQWTYCAGHGATLRMRFDGTLIYARDGGC